MSGLISAQLKRHVDDSTDPVAVFDGHLKAVYANPSWPPALYDLRTPALALEYLQDQYECSTLLQGVQEIIEGKQPLYTRRCQFRLGGQPAPSASSVQVTVTRVALADGSYAAGIWLEQALGPTPPDVSDTKFSDSQL